MSLEWQNKTIGSMLKEASEVWPENSAIRYDGQEVSYKELFTRACRLAKGLSKIGVKKGDHVGTNMDTLPEWLWIKYALHILGAVIVPINTVFARDEFKFVLNQADISTLITVDEFRNRNFVTLLEEVAPEIKSAKPGIDIQSGSLPSLRRFISVSPAHQRYDNGHDFEELMRLGEDFALGEIDTFLQQVRPDNICNILYTTGSTAFPKGAMHTHNSLLRIAANFIVEPFKLTDKDRLLAYFPFHHIAGCVYYVLAALLCGCSIIVTEFIPDIVLPLIEKEKATLLGGFETNFNRLIEHPSFKKCDTSSIKKVLLAAGPEWYDKISESFSGVEIKVHHYGFTEGTGVVVPAEEQDYAIRKNSNGKPLPAVEVKIVNPDTGEKLSPDVPGEICVKGPQMFKGYYNMPQETEKSVDSEGFFHSGDYGWMDRQGNIYYRGRYKMMIKTGGENVSEKEVENFLEGIPTVKAVQVVGVPDERWMEAVTAIIETKPGTSLTQEDVINYCKGKIAGYKIPKYVLFVNETDWPLKSTGKVDKRTLKEWAVNKIGNKEVS